MHDHPKASKSNSAYVELRHKLIDQSNSSIQDWYDFLPHLISRSVRYLGVARLVWPKAVNHHEEGDQIAQEQALC